MSGSSTTGVAGPDPPDGQPVGTVFIGVATPVGCARRVAAPARATGDAIRHEAARAGDPARARGHVTRIDNGRNTRVFRLGYIR